MSSCSGSLPLAQRLQHLAQQRFALEEILVEAELLHILVVEELQALVRPEDDDAGREALQHVAMGADMAGELTAALLEGGLVDGAADDVQAGADAGQRRLRDLEQAAVAGDH